MGGLVETLQTCIHLILILTGAPFILPEVLVVFLSPSKQMLLLQVPQIRNNRLQINTQLSLFLPFGAI
jgi:hypothetical protein